MLLFSAPRLLPERSCTQAFLACVYVAVQHCPSSAVADIVLLNAATSTGVVHHRHVHHDVPKARSFHLSEDLHLSGSVIGFGHPIPDGVRASVPEHRHRHRHGR